MNYPRSIPYNIGRGWRLLNDRLRSLLHYTSQSAKRRWRRSVVCAASLVILSILSATTRAHVFVFEVYRVGASPPYEGSGWTGECFLNIPDTSATTLLTAEAYIVGRTPDFTFRTEWIDFPAGPTDAALDTSFSTIGEFLNDYVFDVSDPVKLNEPFGNFVLRFNGYLKVSFSHNTLPDPNLPVWVEFGTNGYDGFRLRVHDTVYRLPIVDPEYSFYYENCITEGLGLYPIQFTYFNRYDPDNAFNMNRAGVELYSWHDGGLPWPAGNYLIHPYTGEAATIVPPSIIYQADDILPLMFGDFDAEHDVDIRDFQWLQNCFTGDGAEDGGFLLDPGCDMLDVESDDDIDLIDQQAMNPIFAGPALP